MGAASTVAAPSWRRTARELLWLVALPLAALLLGAAATAQILPGPAAVSAAAPR